MRSLYIFLITFLSSYITLSQNPLCMNIVSGGGNAEGHAMKLTADSGYIIAGMTKGIGAGNNDVYIVKLDKNGNRQWTRTVGGKGDDVGNAVVQTFDGGYAVAGWTNSFNQPTRGYDFYIIRLDANGVVLWTRVIGKNSIDEAWAIVQTADSGLAVAGQTSSFGGNDMYVVKLDKNGSLLWDRRVTTGSTSTIDYGMCEAPDGGLVLCGSTYSYTGNIATSSTDFIIVKLTSNGTTLLWSRVVRDPTPYNPTNNFIGYDYARCVINTNDGGFMVVGESEQEHSSGGKDWHYLAVKLTGNGAISWTRYYGGLNIPGQSIDNSDFPRGVVQTADGGYAIGGSSFSFNYDYSRHVATGTDVLLVKCDSLGAFQYSHVIGTDINDVADALVLNPDGTFAMVGYNYKTASDENIYFMKLDSSVSACCTRTLGGDRGTGGTAGIAGSSSTAGGTMYSDSGTFNMGGSVFDLGVCGSIAPPPTAVFQSSDSSFCAGNCITYTDLGHNATAWRWYFPGGTPASSNAENPTVCYLNTGSYDVGFVALNNNDSDSVYVSNMIQVLIVPPTPTIFQSGDTLICSTDSSYITYQWYDSSAVIVGATNSMYVAVHTGNYNVLVTNSNGCAVASGINIVLGEQLFADNGFHFTVGPNPVRDELMVDVNGVKSLKEYVITVYDMMGKMRFTRMINMEGGRQRLDCGELPAGVYYLKLEGGDRRFTYAFVKL